MMMIRYSLTKTGGKNISPGHARDTDAAGKVMSYETMKLNYFVFLMFCFQH